MPRLLLLSLLLAAACGGRSAAPPAPAALACPRAIDGLGELIAPGSTLFLGEVHGTNESPAFLGDLACAAVLRGPTTVALEIPVDEQARIDAFLASAGSEADRAALLAGAFWHRELQDGRSSAAMLGILDRIRRDRAAGADLAILAYDVPSDAVMGGAERDRAMAEAFIAARRAAPARTFLGYGGNVHSRNRVGTPWDPAYEPMAWHIAEAGIAVVSLDVRLDGGSAWTCMQDRRGHMKCGESGKPGTPLERTWYVELGATDTGHDGFYVVGPTTASPPAVAR